MSQYLITFDASWWTAPEEDLPEVARDAVAVEREAKEAGVWLSSGGLTGEEEVTVVAADGTVIDGPYPESKEYLGGFTVIEVPTRAEALRWAGRIAVACRCPQKVRELLPEPTLE